MFSVMLYENTMPKKFDAKLVVKVMISDPVRNEMYCNISRLTPSEHGDGRIRATESTW